MALDRFRTGFWARFGKALTLVLSLVMVGSLVNNFTGGSSPRLVKGSALPTNVSLIGLQNAVGPIKLEALKGKPVLVNFWATWCGFCVKELPLLEDLHARFGPQGLVILAVSDEPPETIRRWLGRATAPKLSFPIAYDASGRLARQLNVRTIPFSVFLDKEGAVVTDVTGVLNEGDAVTTIEGLLK